MSLAFSCSLPKCQSTLTILVLHIVSANLLIPKFIANRVSIGPVAATIGILFWGWLWGMMGLLLAVPLTAFIKLVADLHPSLCHLSNMLALTPRPTPRWVRYSETALERIQRSWMEIHCEHYCSGAIHHLAAQSKVATVSISASSLGSKAEIRQWTRKKSILRG